MCISNLIKKILIISCPARHLKSVDEHYTVQCIINRQSSVLEKTPEDCKIIRDRIFISYCGVYIAIKNWCLIPYFNVNLL